LKHQYNINPEYYDKLYKKQKGKCLICSKHQSELKGKLNIDHNHKTSEIRGLLCHACNNGLGCFKDDAELLVAAYNYLREH